MNLTIRCATFPYFLLLNLKIRDLPSVESQMTLNVLSIRLTNGLPNIRTHPQMINASRNHLQITLYRRYGVVKGNVNIAPCRDL